MSILAPSRAPSVSVLDFGIIAPGRDGASDLRDSLELADAAERLGYNTFWVGNFSYAVDYDGFSPDLFPAGSERRHWLEERRSRLRENIRAAKAYHLNVCITSLRSM